MHHRVAGGERRHELAGGGHVELYGAHALGDARCTTLANQRKQLGAARELAAQRPAKVAAGAGDANSGGHRGGRLAVYRPEFIASSPYWTRTAMSLITVVPEPMAPSDVSAPFARFTRYNID